MNLHARTKCGCFGAAPDIHNVYPPFFAMIKTHRGGLKDLPESVILERLAAHEIGDEDAVGLIRWALRKDSEIFPTPHTRGEMIGAMILQSGVGMPHHPVEPVSPIPIPFRAIPSLTTPPCRVPFQALVGYATSWALHARPAYRFHVVAFQSTSASTSETKSCRVTAICKSSFGTPPMSSTSGGLAFASWSSSPLTERWTY